MFARAHLQTALQLVQTYTGKTPFVHFLKQYFSVHKKHGSRDRKQIAQLCYCWFRLGAAFTAAPPEDRMVIALFLCSTAPSPYLAALHPHWNELADITLADKLTVLYEVFPGLLDETALSAAIFPWQDALSDGIDQRLFGSAHLYQPDLFIRARPAYEELTVKKLHRSGIAFTRESLSCFRLPNGSKTETLFELNKEVVVQDLNSQKAGSMVEEVSAELKQREDLKIWDACAASGGKSILIFDKIPGAELTVTDIRPSILQNLYQRFKQAGLYSYNGFTADLSQDTSSKIGEGYRSLAPQDLIIADLPCSGSGTWSRTPEQLVSFEEATIAEFASLQKKILQSLLPKLAEGGYLLYITCSVFKEENEKNIEWLLKRGELISIRTELLKGYEHRADTMFATLLKKK